MNTVLFAIVAYVLVQFLIGALVSRRMASESDYILAGRRLGVGLITFSVFATYFGAEAIVASGGAVYEKGLTGALVDPVGYAVAIILVGVFFARALWSRGLTTFADLFRHRYSAGVEQLVVVVLVPGSVIWAAAQEHRQSHLVAIQLSLMKQPHTGHGKGSNGSSAVPGRRKGRRRSRFVVVLDEANELLLKGGFGTKVQPDRLGVAVLQPVVELLVVAEIKAQLLEFPFEVPVGFGDKEKIGTSLFDGRD